MAPTGGRDEVLATIGSWYFGRCSVLLVREGNGFVERQVGGPRPRPSLAWGQRPPRARFREPAPNARSELSALPPQARRTTRATADPSTPLTGSTNLAASVGQLGPRIERHTVRLTESYEEPDVRTKLTQPPWFRKGRPSPSLKLRQPPFWQSWIVSARKLIGAVATMSSGLLEEPATSKASTTQFAGAAAQVSVLPPAKVG
jgi:hypothetical protein